ncbi:carbohydrate esterase family 3 protein [Annulohypoxylon maeteangense]|uniref:carbohydrate esterase family 3 protein n=1 Tax=Annulohypoxylon maeteangense TaxID=1927788 RepID=UPI00200851BD|nr:carbohydrate esterase family 3 protein [Annulohypoxylon maeteangense]KAI0881819.1 carbohydrate esterase family 3 protein [Annulohypoxylon maeteangense]
MEHDRSEESVEPRKASCFGFLHREQLIAAFAALGCFLVAAIVLIALAATGTIHAGSPSNDSTSQKRVVNDVSMPGSTSTPTSTALGSATSDSTQPSFTPSVVNSAAVSHVIPLRIMALGASIVKGETSPGYLGFRKPMRDELVDSGFIVNMVGSVQLGDFVDNEVEAYGGKKVTEMHDYAKKIVPQSLPNLFVVHLGTNNLLQNKDTDKVGSQMKDLIDYLLTASNQSTVIMSTMLTNKVPDKEPKVLDMNKQYRDMMKGFEADQKPVVLAEMHPSEGVPGTPTTDDIGPDGSHPTVKGYEMMASLFVKAIKEAEGKGFFRKAVDNGTPEDGSVEK